MSLDSLNQILARNLTRWVASEVEEAKKTGDFDYGELEQRILKSLRIAERHTESIYAPLNPLSRLDKRDHEVLKLLRQGMPNRMIAQALGASTNTVDHRVSRLCRLTGAKSIMQLVEATKNWET